MRVGLTIYAIGFASCLTSIAKAELLPVVNGSFESPSTTFVTQAATGWTLGGPPESAISGVFNNNTTQPGDPAHITNADGVQLAFIGTETGNEMTQIIPGSAYQPGMQYRLSAGIALSNSLKPRVSDAVRLALYYVDANNARHTLAATDVVNSAENGLATNLLTYFTAQTPVLLNDNPAVGRAIGVQLTTIGASGRYFDLDDVTVDGESFVIGEEALVVDYPAASPAGASVPEPGIFEAVGGGAALMALRRRKGWLVKQ